MARINHQIITKRFRNKPAAVVACLFLLLLVLSPGPARADYLISTSNGEIVTQSYWILGDLVYLYEGFPPMEFSKVNSIKEGSFTDLEKGMNRDALKRFFHYSSWLVTKDEKIMLSQGENLKAMGTIDELRALKKTRSEIKKAVKALSARLDDLERQASTLKDYWRGARIPEKTLVIARDVKYLQLLSLRSSIRQCRRYLKTWDPTCREYALEYYRQVAQFEADFYEALIRHTQR